MQLLHVHLVVRTRAASMLLPPPTHPHCTALTMPDHPQPHLLCPCHWPHAGVLQVEAMAQLAGIAMLDPENTAAKGLFFFGGIENCRFRKPVVPGDVLVRLRAYATQARPPTRPRRPLPICYGLLCDMLPTRRVCAPLRWPAA